MPGGHEGRHGGYGSHGGGKAYDAGGHGSGNGGTGGGGGVPDGLLIGIIVFLLGTAVLVWSSTGLAGLFAHGSWPDGVTFSRTPLAMRHLIGQPHDITGAWPGTPQAALSGYGLFWGLFIGQLMVLFVLLVFVLGTIARWRARRAARRDGAPVAGEPGRSDKSGQSPAHDQPHVPDDSSRPDPSDPSGLPSPSNPTDRSGPSGPPGPSKPSVPSGLSVPAGPHGPFSAYESAVASGRADTVAPDAVGRDAVAPTSGSGGPARMPDVDAVPEPTAAAAVQAPAAAEPAPGPPVAPGLLLGDRAGAPAPVLGPPAVRRAAAVQAVGDAEGPVLVVTSDPSVWAETKDARAKLGPVLLYDPTHRCDTPARLHWSPSAGCADRDVAAERARALLAPVRPTARIDGAVADTAETLLRCFLHAAAVDGRPFRLVHRWAQGTQIQDAVRTLRSHQRAASGAAGELEAALTAYPQRRDIAQELTARALAALSSVHIRDACTPNRADTAALDSFVAEGGTLYLVGEAIEDPKSHPGAMPLLTALASSVVEHGRRMAERSSSGRLDPPFSLVLEDVAAVAPLPQLPALLSSGADRGLPTLALLRSREQARTRWPNEALPQLS